MSAGSNIATNMFGPTLYGVVVIGIGVALFALWAVMAPLASAVIAPGVLIVESKRKEVEHLEGGLIHEIKVKEGQSVKAGEVLLVIESVASTSRLNQLVQQRDANKIRLARVEAEFRGEKKLAMPEDVELMRKEEEFAKLISLQEDLFAKRQKSMAGQQAVFNEQIAQTGQEIKGLRARITADRKRLDLTKERLVGMTKIFNQGHATRPQVAELEADAARLEGDIAENRARISGLKRRISELSQEKINLETEFSREVTTEYQEVKGLLAEVGENLNAAQDVVKRKNVLAPIGGKVVGLNVHTIGAVVSGGEKLMEIVPDDELIVEALIKPEDIDQVHPGQSVMVRLTAFNFRSTPPVEASLYHISADRVVDSQSGVAAYHARVRLKKEHLATLEGLDLYPGMPAEAIIQQGERTFFDYIAGPVLRTFERGLREL